jgi:prepilin-type N-terminal cleavage/methylation domain-containing protein
MKTIRSHRRAGFSLIEMIGVLAIMAIMASVIVPNALRSLDRAAIRAEVASLDAVGEQLKLYLRTNGVLPTTAAPNNNPNWTTQLGAFADLSPTDLYTNKRNRNRLYVTNAATQRAMFLSSMRSNLALPTFAQVNNNFAAIWDTPDGVVPTTPGWGGWGGTANAGDYLVIERVNLAPVYATDLIALTVTLNNNGGGTVSYRVVSAAGVAGAPVNIAAGATATLTNLRPRERVDLYTGGGGTGLDYSYVLSNSGKTFDFGGTQWLPQ